jgi:hypothetical protein
MGLERLLVSTRKVSLKLHCLMLLRSMLEVGCRDVDCVVRRTEECNKRCEETTSSHRLWVVLRF